MNVGARVDLAAGLKLLGRGPSDAPDELARRREARGARGIVLLEHLGDAEVQESRDTVAVDQDVLRLQVAVHDSMPVRVFERRADLQEQV